MEVRETGTKGAGMAEVDICDGTSPLRARHVNEGDS